MKPWNYRNPSLRLAQVADADAATGFYERVVQGRRPDAIPRDGFDDRLAAARLGDILRRYDLEEDRRKLLDRIAAPKRAARGARGRRQHA
jgi:hypothetical protein